MLACVSAAPRASLLCSPFPLPASSPPPLPSTPPSCGADAEWTAEPLQALARMYALLVHALAYTEYVRMQFNACVRSAGDTASDRDCDCN